MYSSISYHPGNTGLTLPVSAQCSDAETFSQFFTPLLVDITTTLFLTRLIASPSSDISTALHHRLRHHSRRSSRRSSRLCLRYITEIEALEEEAGWLSWFWRGRRNVASRLRFVVFFLLLFSSSTFFHSFCSSLPFLLSSSAEINRRKLDGMERMKI